MDASASTAHGTASNPLGPSQATAPVLEFRCLFTRDVHKKAKKWHDGSLRFHTFNSRVMVYDESNFLVGDVHYRGNEEVGEGLELTLDRPVLVEVGERSGSTETDLNQVLHQRPTPEKPTVRSTVRSVLASQPKPKSIKEVLGASQGQIGRTRVPYQSPYDRRHVLQSSHPAEPPTKRARIATDKENEPQTAASTTTSTKPIFAVPQRRLPSPKAVRPSRPKYSTQDLVGRVEEVYELSSDEEDVPVSRRKAALVPQQVAQADHTALTERARNTRATPVKATSAPQKPAKEQTRRKAKVRERTEPRPATASSRTAPTRSALGSSVYIPRPNTTQLHFTREKPRRKLMYRALLSSSHVQSGPSQDAQRPPATDKVLADSSKYDEDEQDPADDSFDTHSQRIHTLAPRNHLESPQPIDNIDKHSLHSPDEPNTVADRISIPSSPLFVPRDDDNPEPSAACGMESSQEFETRMLEGAKPAGQTAEDPIELSPKPASLLTTPKDVNISSTRFVNDLSPSPPSSRSPSPEVIDIQSAKTAQQAMPPPPLPLLARTVEQAHANDARLSSRHSPIRRALSLNDADNEDLPENFPSDTQFGGASNLLSEFPPTAALLNPIRSPLRRTSPRKGQVVAAQLRRTFSDPVVVDSRVATERTVTLKGVNVEQPEVEPGEEETGPWSIKEAWLLFGTDGWHVGRREALPGWTTAVGPAWSAGGAATDSNGGAGSGGAGAAMGGFRSARGLLERERTAQGTGVLRDEEGVY